MEICLKILVPDASEPTHGIGISQDGVLGDCLSQDKSLGCEPWWPRDFFAHVYTPAVNDRASLPTAQQLQFTLYPFQERAVRWLLRREGMSEPEEDPKRCTELPHGFIRTNDGDGKPCVSSRALGLVTTDVELPFRLGSKLRGGILAEEMGLGKTVELISLICLHKHNEPQNHAPQMQQSSATLIVTPPTILEQWINELNSLAPNLSVFVYGGLRAEASRSNHQELLTKCASYDVVLTTYNILAKEIHYAGGPERSLRHEKKYQRRQSPLTQTLWWRVILDEAQMVESGVSNAAKVAKLIPRRHAWAVSGTPVQKNARDLLGLLDFLKYEPYCDLSVQQWDRLVVRHKDVLHKIFNEISLRHTKEQIKDEIQLPPQKRVVISVGFNQIEEQHYSTLFNEMSQDCGLTPYGAPLSDGWDPDASVVVAKMRNSLVRLRQTCLHAEVGAKNRRALGNGKGALRSVGEVLEVMIEQNESAARAEERSLMLSQIRRGQILEHANFSQEALEIWLMTLAEAKSIVQDCRDAVRVETEKLGLGEDGEVDEAARATMHTGPRRLRFRAALEVEHVLTFFVANAYYQIKSDERRTKPGSDQYSRLGKQEENWYEQARVLRKELLVDIRSKADFFINKINTKALSESWLTLPMMPALGDKAGIESRVFVDKLNELILVMQRQDNQFMEWREKTIQLLRMPLVDEEETDLQGDEYETSTKQQDEVYVFVDALRALNADRHDILTGQKNELISHETAVNLRQAKEGAGHSPELQIRLITTRNKLLPHKNLGSIRSLTAEVRESRTSLHGAVERHNQRAAVELMILNDVFHKLHKLSNEQSKVRYRPRKSLSSCARFLL